MYLIVQAGQELLRFHPLTASADHLSAPRSQNGFLETFSYVALFGRRVVHFHNVCAQSSSDTSRPGDEVRVTFVTDRLASWIGP